MKPYQTQFHLMTTVFEVGPYPALLGRSARIEPVENDFPGILVLVGEEGDERSFPIRSFQRSSSGGVGELWFEDSKPSPQFEVRARYVDDHLITSERTTLWARPHREVIHLYGPRWSEYDPFIVAAVSPHTESVVLFYYGVTGTYVRRNRHWDRIGSAAPWRMKAKSLLKLMTANPNETDLASGWDGVQFFEDSLQTSGGTIFEFIDLKVSAIQPFDDVQGFRPVTFSTLESHVRSTVDIVAAGRTLLFGDVEFSEFAPRP